MDEKTPPTPKPPPRAAAATAPAATVPPQVAKPPARDPLWFSPVFVLAPARSNSSVVASMLSEHPELCGFPELALYRKETVQDLLIDPPGWKGPPTRLRLAGLFRALAQHHTGTQTPEGIAAAARWVDERRAWHVADVFDHLLSTAAPRTGIEKSPEDSSRQEYLARLNTSYPRARFLHLTRHPVPSVASMHRVWSDKGYWTIAPELFHQFCLGVWYYQHARIATFVDGLPPDRGFRVRSEDILNSPAESLPKICRWLGLDGGSEAVDAMCHPERSVYAGTGPAGALGGWDTGFMQDPVLHTTALPSSLEFPPDWILDPWLQLAALELAARLGYS